MKRMTLLTRMAVSVCLLLPVYATAQFQVHGTIKDVSGAGIPFASVVVLNQNDSSLVKGQLSTEQGTFDVNVSEAGTYFVSISSTGYETTASDVFTLSSAASSMKLTMVAAEQASTLNEVVVRGEKPFFEQKIDRTVINVQSAISRAGGTALDILQRSPGVTVDRMNNAISLSGKQGVRIMINGKISRLPMESVVQMLGGMNAENIERIELITTPPSRYEAEGDAGMINIVLKQSADLGTNGNVSAFTGYGRDVKYGGTLNLNRRSRKVNVYGDFNTRQDHTEEHLNTTWSVPVDDETRETISNNFRKGKTGIISGSLGTEWEVSKKTSVGGLFSIFDRRWDMDALADIGQYTDESLSSSVRMNTIEENDWTQYLSNINLTHRFNDKQNLTFNVDYIDYASQNPTHYTQDYSDPDGTPAGSDQLRSGKETQINIWTSSLDITHKINDQVSFEYGAKGSFTQLDNDIIVSHYEDPEWTVDPELTVFASMYENILAGYISTTFKASAKLDIMMGVRYEHTVTNIDTDEQANAVDRNYGKWFPSIFLNKKIDDNNSFVLSYSRRISRPSFFQLAPFVIFNDPNNFYSGNISLLPSFTDALKAEFRHKTFLVSLLYSYDKNGITLFQPEVNEDGKQVSMAQNLDYLQTYGVVITFPVQITKWWEIQVNANGSLNSLRATYLEDAIDLSVASYTGNAIQKFTISKSVTAEITGYYQAPRYFGVSKIEGFGGVDLGLEKRFTNSSLRFSYTDILQTNKWDLRANIKEQNLNSQIYLDFETTVATVTYNWNFGNSILKGASRKSGSRDEQDRLRQ